MMPNVSRGHAMIGLTSYLAGDGKANEHTDPHLVAGDDLTWIEFGGHTLSMPQARAIGYRLDESFRRHQVNIPAGHVWHCSLSLSPEERDVSDDEFGAIAREFVHRMGYDDADGTKASCAWAAFRHGRNVNGGQHIHIALCLVRDDGTKASTYFTDHGKVIGDQGRTQQVCRELETEFNLTRLESVSMDRSTIGYTKAEAARVVSQLGHEGPVRLEQTDRGRLQLLVRAAATAASDEGDFVRRLRTYGVLVRPRFGQGGTDMVVGFSVALRVVNGRPIWFAPSKLAHDLALPRLRQNWAGVPGSRDAGMTEWLSETGAGVNAARGSIDETQLAAANRRLEQLTAQLRTTPMGDQATWVHVARQLAGVFSAMSARFEKDQPGPLAQCAAQLGALSSTKTPEPVPINLDMMVLSDIASLGMLALAGDDPRRQAMITARNLAHLLVACRAFMMAQNQLRLATQAYDLAENKLRALQWQRFERPAGQAVAQDHHLNRTLDAPTAWDVQAIPPGRPPSREAAAYIETTRATQQPSYLADIAAQESDKERRRAAHEVGKAVEAATGEPASVEEAAVLAMTPAEFDQVKTQAQDLAINGYELPPDADALLAWQYGRFEPYSIEHARRIRQARAGSATVLLEAPVVAPAPTRTIMLTPPVPTHYQPGPDQGVGR